MERETERETQDPRYRKRKTRQKKKKTVKERSNKKAEDVAKASEMVSLYVCTYRTD